jgi:hypothetical protein
MQMRWVQIVSVVAPVATTVGMLIALVQIRVAKNQSRPIDAKYPRELRERAARQARFDAIAKAAADAVAADIASAAPRLSSHLFYGESAVDPRHLVTWYLFATDAELAEAKRNGLTERIETLTREHLGRRGYPAEALPQIHISFTTDEDDVSKAVVLFLGFESGAPVPQWDGKRIAQAFGAERATDLEARVASIVREMKSIPVDWSTHSLGSAEKMVHDEMHRRHPELSVAALRALMWLFQYDWK